MGYDLEVYTITTHHTDNYTSNVGKMYSHAFEQIKELAEPYLKKAWYTCDDFKDALNSEREVSLPVIKLMLMELKAHAELYKTYNPENKWGNYEGAVQFLQKACDVLEQNENSQLKIEA